MQNNKTTTNTTSFYCLSCKHSAWLVKFDSNEWSIIGQEDSWISWFQTGLYLRLKSVFNHRLIITWFNLPFKVQLFMLASLKHQHFLVLESCTIEQIINSVICQSGSSCFCSGVRIPVSSAVNVAVLLLSQLKQTPCIQQGVTYTKGHCYQWHKARPDPHFLPRNQANGHISIGFNGRTAANDSMYQIPCAEPRQTPRSKGEGNVRRGPATWDSPQTTLFETNWWIQDYESISPPR